MTFAIVSTIIMVVFIFAMFVWSPYKAHQENKANRLERRESWDAAQRHRREHGLELMPRDERP